MKLKRYQRTLLVSGLYVVLLAILLVTATLSRYADTKLAYTSFGAASFNVVVLSSDQWSALNPAQPDQEETESGEVDQPQQLVNQLTTSLSTQHFLPGMTWSETAGESTAAEISFYVANGTSEEDASQVGVVYTIRLRTGGSLPLKYTLAVQTGASDPNTGSPVYAFYSSGEATALLDESGAVAGYEYVFYLEKSGGSDAAPLSEESPQPDTSEPEAEEVSFKLSGNALSQNPHRLIIEWPADTGMGTSSKAYMKEVEILELLVTASSLNQLENEDYVTPPTDSATYSSGIILLTPPEEGDAKGFSYTIDYRSFEFGEGTTGSFQFSVDNGIDYGIAQRHETVAYTAKLKVPAEVEYQYTLSYTKDDGTPEALSLADPNYRLYNEKTGDYTVESDDMTPTNPDETLYRWYAVYALPGGLLRNTTTDSGSGLSVPYGDADGYTLQINSDGISTSDADYIKSICFENKLELLLEASYSAAADVNQ